MGIMGKGIRRPGIARQRQKAGEGRQGAGVASAPMSGNVRGARHNRKNWTTNGAAPAATAGSAQCSRPEPTVKKYGMSRQNQ